MHQPAANESRRPGLLRPFQAFLATESASGIVLFACAVVALVWANSPWAAAYDAVFHTYVSFGVGPFRLSHSLLHWINDGLMAVFFFVVGLEIKREVLIGELSSIRKATLPLVAAVGGMVAPALIYVAVVLLMGASAAVRGWAVPTATDIAFALGVLAVLGRRAPLGLKVFLTALAIADDLGAVLVIAAFYTSNLSGVALGVAGGVLAALVAANLLGVRRTLVYVVLGLALWLAVLQSGIHATIAGVLLALTIPAKRKLDTVDFLARGRRLLDAFAADRRPGQHEPTDDQRHAIYALEDACEKATEPLRRIEHALHPWVAFGIMPVFALANAGVTIRGDLSGFAEPVSLGVFLGLIVGKQVGVFSAAWLAVRVGLAKLPAGTSWRQLYGVCCLCGIGFTMSLFIAGLAFASPAKLDAAKVGILAGSIVSAAMGAVVLLTGGRAGRGGDHDDDRDVGHAGPA